MSLLDDLFALFGYVPAARYEAARRRLESAVETHNFNRKLYERTVFDLADARERIATLQAYVAALEAEFEEATADTAEEPPEAPAPPPAATSPWRPPGWYRDLDGRVGQLFAVDPCLGEQAFCWSEPSSTLGPGATGVRQLGPASVQRLEPVQGFDDEPAGGAR